MSEKENTTTRTPAGNGRFCEMAAVTPQTILCELERYYPAANVVEAATSQSRLSVICKRREHGRESRETSSTCEAIGAREKYLHI